MPITARLSKQFYDRFGDEIVQELVELLNQVDLTYRSELREQNEVNFARLDAKLEQRVAEMRADVTRLDDRVTAMSSRFDSRLDLKAAELHSDIAALKAELIKWMFLFWAGTALAGLLLR